jgi:hypothetical protein
MCSCKTVAFEDLVAFADTLLKLFATLLVRRDPKGENLAVTRGMRSL